MKIAVGSRNPVKVKAVKRGFSLFFKEDIIVTSLNVKTSVGDQPIGLEKVILGSLERAKKAIEKTECDFGVGIEAGLIKIPGTISGYMDFQVCAIIDKERNVTLGFGPGFEFPPKAVDSVLKGYVCEIEEILSKMSGIKEIGNNIGGIGWLTKDVIDREELSLIAVVMALVPRVNERLYKERYRSLDDVLNDFKNA